MRHNNTFGKHRFYFIRNFSVCDLLEVDSSTKESKEGLSEDNTINKPVVGMVQKEQSVKGML